MIDSLIALMLVGVLAGILVYHRQQQRTLDRYQAVHRALALLSEQATFHGALGAQPNSPAGFPLQVSPLWFEKGTLPTNTMVPGRHPWMDVAHAQDRSDQPPDPVITTSTQAGFWYNPNRGIFRARVLPQFSDDETRRLYNQLNGTALLILPHPKAASPANKMATVDR